ncbi:unnamed protein product [Candidula unifasciata]|uniref:Cytochrome P450 n=1 Tax=Candidula unifasciata TaxID=100452 RepID=A0A8S3YES5_9EUPU|nr:unnamed protein product [Candidula unifasciata]
MIRLKTTTASLRDNQEINYRKQIPDTDMSPGNEYASSVRPLPFSSMPGPRGLRKLPYIGTALLFKPFSRFTPETFGEMVSYMHDKYGCIFKSRLGKDYSVYTDNLRDIETIFRTEDTYPLRRLMTLSRVFRERNGLPHALGTVSGPEWYELRSPLNPLLNRPQVCLHYLPAQNQVADDFVSRLQTNVFSPEQLSEEFFKFAAESIGIVCYNRRLGFLEPVLSAERVQLLESFKIALHCTFIAMMGLERRYLKTADDAFYRQYEDAMKFIRNQSMLYVEKVKEELKVRPFGNDKNDTNAGNKARVESNLLASMIVNSQLDIEKILAIIDSMLIAGTDSTARNLAILFYNLAQNPDVQDIAAKEVTSLIGTQHSVTPATLAKMNYVKSCVKESMRLNFPLSNGTERTLTSDTVLSGYLVPKGTSVIMSSRRMSLDPANFPHPLQFKPERWMRDGTLGPDETGNSKKGSAFACLPFGHGARGCIGRRFAELEMYVAAAKVLQKLQIRVDHSYSGLDSIYTPFITPKKPIPFIFTERT